MLSSTQHFVHPKSLRQLIFIAAMIVLQIISKELFIAEHEQHINSLIKNLLAIITTYLCLKFDFLVFLFDNQGTKG